MAKRILISWAIVAAVACLIGVLIGALTHRTKQKEILIYGEYDGRIFEGEMSHEWGSGSKFVPLDISLDEDLQQYIFYLSAAYDLDYPLVLALIQHETNYQPDKVSNAGDYGLMQINQINHSYLAEELGITDFLDPYQNVKAGMFILRKLFEKYETTEKVLMAYNMGEAGASRLWEQGIFESNFSKSIIKIQAEISAEIERRSEQ